MKPVVGIDFDNTLADYGRVISETAVEMGLMPSGSRNTKSQIRDYIRHLPDGELEWQKLQASIYGPEIRRAVPSPGAMEFLIGCRKRGLEAYIVSHKSRFAAQDNGKVDLREAALGWLEWNGFFNERETGINQAKVYFEETRREKLQRIGELGCTHFIDDLVETFNDPWFPQEVERILYTPQTVGEPPSGISLVGDWGSAAKLVFHGSPAC